MIRVAINLGIETSLIFVLQKENKNYIHVANYDRRVAREA